VTATAVDLRAYVPQVVGGWGAAGRHRSVEGTLVSADVSGFTKLSEKLAGYGRGGAEELTDLLCSCFERMISSVDAAGGDVLKFGGDALLILFRGEQHAARACAATLAMRAGIAEPLHSPSAGRVALKISQGIHSGAFDLFLVDGAHRELLVTGRGTTETVHCEGTANAGEILLSAAAAAQVDPFWHFQTTGWHEGRNPNALFDVSGYLAAYADVAAAGVNPLDHYHAWGWREGRDPSLAFDTAAYLADNPDVAAAQVDPLKHFLQTGIHEGRAAIADGAWG
jgi:class 3 adenylate cyclase